MPSGPVHCSNLCPKNLKVSAKPLAEVDFLLKEFTDLVSRGEEVEAAEAALLGDNSLQIGDWCH